MCFEYFKVIVIIVNRVFHPFNITLNLKFINLLIFIERYNLLSFENIVCLVDAFLKDEVMSGLTSLPLKEFLTIGLHNGRTTRRTKNNT